MTAKRRRDIRYGNDLYREILLPNAKKPLKVTYWDFWIADVLTREFEGDWDKMCDHFRAEKAGRSFRRHSAEELLNHLHLLRQTLDRAGLTVGDILEEADPAFLKKQFRKARRKVLEMGYQDRNMPTCWRAGTKRPAGTRQASRSHCKANCPHL
jgi:hypothetical protein